MVVIKIYGVINEIVVCFNVILLFGDENPLLGGLYSGKKISLLDYFETKGTPWLFTKRKVILSID